MAGFGNTQQTIGKTPRHESGSVPVVDIAELDGEPALIAIDRACREWGFFQVTGHGIDDAIIDDLFAAAKAFFGRPIGEKRRILRSAGNPWGFYDEELTKNTRDWKQVFDYGPGDGDTLVPRWPDDMPGFREAVLAWHAACESLAHRLLSAIARNLGAPEGELNALFGDDHTSFMRLNYYPRLPPGAKDDSTFGVNEHSDAGALTVLLQDDQAGLEVCRGGEWYLVEPRRDALVINLGDMAQVWSNDRYRAALHRVVTNTDRDRYSSPYFFNPSYDTDYAPLPSCISASNPARYRPINWREFRTRRADGDYADYGDEVQITDYRIRNSRDAP